MNLNAMQAQPLPKKNTEQVDMFFIELEVCGITLYALVNTGASNMFMTTEVAKKLGLEVRPNGRHFKTINSEDLASRGTTPKVEVQIGGWKGKIPFEVVPLDDYDLILGMQFFNQARAMIDLGFKCIIVLDPKCPSMVPMLKGVMNTKMIAAVHLLNKNLKAAKRMADQPKTPPTQDMPIEVLFLEVESMPRAKSEPKKGMCAHMFVKPLEVPFESVRAKRNRKKREKARAKKNSLHAVSAEDVARLSGGECHGGEVSLVNGAFMIEVERPKYPSENPNASASFLGTDDPVLAPWSRVFLS
ncbi:hypothetical protein BT93_L5492 [Corymbia citriodora subsp. variegata]|uniref:Gag-asp_proteas domain-containing protein n=1 Tax=Corymbia citriodora subsp. variegata TaxID=360336 RepID=A0A8T0CS80_CORYI|nr:hypothetical protein BT93_L5492 [Corymbia citriodora subsp. variegata]